MAPDQPISIALITTPERLQQSWINELERSPQIRRLDRITQLPSGLEALRQLRPQLVILDYHDHELEELSRKIYIELPQTITLALVNEPDRTLLRRLALAGVRDVLDRPVTLDEIWASIHEALAVEQQRHQQQEEVETASQHSSRGRLVLVISPKGGAGSTMVCTNLAIALHQQSNGTEVVLGDFGLQFGHLGTHLNLFSRYTLQDLAAKADELDDSVLTTVLQPHSSGVQVLLPPSSPDHASEITGQQVAVIVEQLLSRYRYLVADTWGVLDEVTTTLLAKADEVLVVTTPEIPALKNVKSFLEYLGQNQLTHGRISIVLNRFPSVDAVTIEDVQQHLRQPISVNIPSAGQLMTYSINRGVPFVISHPQSWASQCVRDLAAYVSGVQGATLSLHPRKGKERNPAKAEATGRRGFRRLLGLT
ncbi:MAG: AAA family ATPase [Oscillochloridaceae bacterium umkhey_bin13]